MHRAARALLRWLGCSVAYFVAATGAAFVARGWDMDQLRERSQLSRAAGVVQDVLWAPHDAALALIGHDPLRIPGIVPGLIVLNMLVGGAVVMLLWRAWADGRARASTMARDARR